MSDTADFIAAVRAGDLAAVQAALGADSALARCRMKPGSRSSCLAVYFGRENVAELLARARTDLDIFEASTLGDARRVRKLVVSDPELVDAYSAGGHSAVAQSDRDTALFLAERLLEAGASLNAVQQGGATPLHEAAFRGQRISFVCF